MPLRPGHCIRSTAREFPQCLLVKLSGILLLMYMAVSRLWWRRARSPPVANTLRRGLIDPRRPASLSVHWLPQQRRLPEILCSNRLAIAAEAIAEHKQTALWRRSIRVLHLPPFVITRKRRTCQNRNIPSRCDRLLASLNRFWRVERRSINHKISAFPSMAFCPVTTPPNLQLAYEPNNATYPPDR